MKRAPIVLSGTALGLVGVLSYHAAAPSSTLATTGTASKAATTSAAASAAATTAAAQTSTTARTAKKSSTSSSSGPRTATGEDVQYQYGDLQVKVTMSGPRITNVSVVQLNVTDPHSDQIDQDAIPQLRQEAMAAGSAKIDGVSGASYTSAAYEQSLQSAIDKLSSTSAPS